MRNQVVAAHGGDSTVGGSRERSNCHTAHDGDDQIVPFGVQQYHLGLVLETQENGPAYSLSCLPRLLKNCGRDRPGIFVRKIELRTCQVVFIIIDNNSDNCKMCSS